MQTDIKTVSSSNTGYILNFSTYLTLMSYNRLSRSFPMKLTMLEKSSLAFLDGGQFTFSSNNKKNVITIITVKSFTGFMSVN